MPNNTEIEDKKTEINFNNKNILLHSSITFPFYPWKFEFSRGGRGGYSATSDLDLGKNLEIWISRGGYSATSDLNLGKKLEIWGGVFCNFGFGLREKLGNLDFPVGNLRRGVFCNFGFGLREKLGNLDFPEGGVFCNFGFGLREKVGNLDFPDLDLGKNLEIWIFQSGGGYSATSDLDLGKNLEIWIFP